MNYFIIICVTVFILIEATPLSNFHNNPRNLKDIDWGKVESDFGKVSTSVTQATNSWGAALDLIKAGSNILGPIGSIVSFAEFVIGLGEPGPEEAILKKLEQLEETLMNAFKRLGEKMDAGFNQVLHHIDRTDYRQKVIDEIRPLWDKFLILSKHPNMTDALHKFVKACDAHKPEETLGNMYERIATEPSILTSLKKASIYDWDAFESFSSSALQQLIQLQSIFGYCELIANNLTDISQSSSKDSFESNLKDIAKAIREGEAELKKNFLQAAGPPAVHECIDKYGRNNNGLNCILKTMKKRFSWTSFNLQSCAVVFHDPCPHDCIAQSIVYYSGLYIITDLKRLNMCSGDACYILCQDVPWNSNSTLFLNGISMLKYKNELVVKP